MRQKSNTNAQSSEDIVKGIRRATRKRYSAEEKIRGWGWFYPSTILDDFSRYLIAWKLCTTMRADDVTDTLRLALKRRLQHHKKAA